MRRLLFAIASALLFGDGVFAQTGGRDLYIAKCSTCHAPDGSGKSTVGRSLSVGDMRPSIKSMTDEQLRQIIVQGKGKMPPLKKFDDEKMRNLTLFLRDLVAGNPNAGRAVAEAQAQPLPHVQDVFRDKCSACHAQDGTGRTTIGRSLQIPDLTSAAAQGERVEEVAEVISKGKGRMPSYARTFNPAQVGQLASYIRSLRESSGVQKPVESAEPPISTPQPLSSPPNQTVAQPDSSSLAPSSGSSAIPEKSSTLEERKTAELQPKTAPRPAKAPKSARQIYVAKCSACHSSDGSGSGTIGRSMRIPSLASPQVQGKSDDSLASVISNGVGKMPAYKKKFSPEEIQRLVDYIRELGKIY